MFCWCLLFCKSNQSRLIWINLSWALLTRKIRNKCVMYMRASAKVPARNSPLWKKCLYNNWKELSWQDQILKRICLKSAEKHELKSVSPEKKSLKSLKNQKSDSAIHRKKLKPRSCRWKNACRGRQRQKGWIPERAASETAACKTSSRVDKPSW